jgi:hypothetical protein
MNTLCSSIYVLPESRRTIVARELWREMASDVAGEFCDQYVFSGQWGYRICLQAEASTSPDKKLVRYRTIEATIRRRSGHPTLLDLAVGNMFASVLAEVPEPLHVVNDPKYSLWARHAGEIPLADHVRLIRQFTGDLMDVGWVLQKIEQTVLHISPPMVQNGRGQQRMPMGNFHSLARYPAKMMEPQLELAVVWPEIATASRIADQLTRSFSDLFGSHAQHLPPIRKLRKPEPGAVNLVLLDDRKDLNDLPEMRDTLREAEAAGTRFKLAKLGSMGKTYPARNIAYDMFLIGGGKPWLPVSEQLAFCSMDAGHHAELGKSRWVKVETNKMHDITQVSVADTGLAEHMPPAILDAMWPASTDALICRDGKLSQERAVMERRAAAEGRPLIESKKSPKAILWREGDNGIHPAEFGDSVVDPHGDVLLQTVPQSVRDYIRPVRLTVQGGDTVALATAFLHQQAVPGLSLFKMSRLPGALYYADLISKLTGDGWPKAVGRGFGVPEIVP